MPKTAAKLKKPTRKRDLLMVEVTAEIKATLGRLVAAKNCFSGPRWTMSDVVRDLIQEAGKKIAG